MSICIDEINVSLPDCFVDIFRDRVQLVLLNFIFASFKKFYWACFYLQDLLQYITAIFLCGEIDWCFFYFIQGCSRHQDRYHRIMN